MPSILVFVFVLGVLVIVHEFGHFLAARRVGVRVEKFSIGFGPVIFGRRFGDTEFCVSLLPLGGFVKLAGENPEEAKGLAWEFNSKRLWEKFFIVFAGPFMNAFLAFVIFSVIFLVGTPTMTTKVGKVMDGTPAKEAGIVEGDRVTALNGQPVKVWEDILEVVHKAAGPVVFSVERDGAAYQFSVMPKVREIKDIFGRKSRLSFVGIAPSNEMIYLKNPPLKAVALGFERVWTLTTMIFYSLALMITGALPFKDSVTGPIGIFFMTQEAAKMGIVTLFYFMGSLSVSLFVLNLLPIPVLDGGHILFILIEKLKGSPLKERVKERMTQGGLVLLLGLMTVVILQDVNRFSIVENFLKIFRQNG
ncbi:MAG: RIP metalloprotease RseP [Omnitrophica bacterium RIFCSPHIGHO2_02_FULL_51_18]|nr:MAG: RIP metalloprotease RseP [Omnitrophica bacterium RIFCSPHIGHO2_02_FULL_51_18]